MQIDLLKAKQALAVLEQEKQEQQQRLLLAEETKRRLNKQRWAIANSTTNGVLHCTLL